MNPEKVTQIFPDRLPPQDTDTEESILSACLLENEYAKEIADLITPGVFYRTAHRKIFAAILDSVNVGTEPNLLEIKNVLEKRNELEECGGAFYLAQLLDIPISVNIEQDTRRLKEKAALREIIKISNEVTGKAFDLSNDPESLVDYIQKEINQISLTNGDRDNSVRSIIHSVCDQIDHRIDNKQKITGVDTGFDGLNWYTGGLQPTDLIIIAARPSMGKTSFALNLLRNASKSGVWVDFYSYEMSKEQLLIRLIGMTGKIKYNSLRTGFLTREELERYPTSAAEVSEYTATIEDNGDLKLGDLRRRARATKKKHNTGLIIIDYLQLIPKEKVNTNDAVGDISRGLKMMAKELNVPVVALSQLNRKLEDRSNKVPTLADLRDSGSIEQDADIVLFPYRPAVYMSDRYEKDGKTETVKYQEEKTKARLFISKHRNGPVGCTELRWESEYSTFLNQSDF